MADQNPVSFTGGQAGNEPPADPNKQIDNAQNQSSNQSGTSEFVTKADYERDFGQFKKDAQSWIKSMADGAENRVQQQVQERFAKIEEQRQLLAGAGVQVTEQQLDQARQQAVQEILNNQSGSGVNGNVQLTPEQAAEARVVDDVLKRMYQEYGFELYPSDPEMQGVGAIDSAYEFINMVKTNLDKKKERLSAENRNAALNRLPGVGGGPGGQTNPIADITDPMTLLNMGNTRK